MDIFNNGSRWIKADFHLHTRADSEFKYEEKDDTNFIVEYVAKLKEAGIGVGVITNHNKFDKAEFKALKKKAKEEQIGLFPGVELSVKEGIHILVVFADIWYHGSENMIQSFLDNAFYGISNPTSPPYPNSRYDLKGVVEALDEIGHPYFICLAHIDDRNGLHKVLAGRTLGQFIEDEAFSQVIAVQKSGDKSKYDDLCNRVGRTIACVEGTDNAEKGLEAIGSGRTTFIKIGDYNFEALKYALLDHGNRVIPKECPKINNSFIKSLSIEGGCLDGTEIDLSPELNTFIGIRGSGKSAVLEIIRYVLGIELSSQSVDKYYKNELVQYILGSGGKVSLHCVNEHGKEYTIVKIYGQKEDIYEDGKRIDATIDGCFKSPVYFGQKDLSNKDIDFEADLIDKLIGSNLAEIRQEIDIQESQLETAVEEYQKLDQLDELKAEVEERIKNAQHKLKLFKEKGVEDKLKKQAQFESDMATVEDIQHELTEFYNGLVDFMEDNTELFSKAPKGKSEDSKPMFEKFRVIYQNIKAEYEKYGTGLENIYSQLETLDKVIEELSSKRDELKDEFAKIQREIDVPNLNADEFLKLNKQITADKATLVKIKKAEESRLKLEQQILDNAIALDKLWHEEFKELQKQIKKINDAESELEIVVEYKGRKDKFVEKMKNIYRGSGIRTTAYDSIAQQYVDFIQIYRDRSHLQAILSESHYAEFLKRLSENLSELLTYQIENKFIINYKGKPLAQHSLGQRASALILFLLAQKDCDVLIIDQPEDDLDNQTIYRDVIRELKKLKGDMQFVFATHNANIPVLGDSEKVIACEFLQSNISIDSGNVDKHSTQKKIVDVMEGGKDAFEHRKKIYGLWRIN